MKNPNGYGGVVNLGKCRRKPWAVRITVGWQNGKQLYRYIGYFPTKKEAVKALATEQVVPTSMYVNCTFEDVYKMWSELHFPRVSPQSVAGYRSAYKSLLKLHKLKFCEIRTNEIQRILDAMRRSVSTKKKIKVLCNMMFNFACENDLVSKNYAHFLRIEKEPHMKKEIFTDSEIAVLCENDCIGCADIILILIYTGLRIQELLNLKKADINMEKSIIQGGLKTDAGRERIIPISPKIQPYVQKYYENAQTYLFIRIGDGKIITQDYFRRAMYYPTLEQLCIRRKTPHSTRHTCASMLTIAGANSVAIEQILGHTDYAFTVDNYVTVDVEFLTQNLNKI